MTNADLNILIIHPDGSYTAFQSDDAVATAGHHCGGYVTRLGEAFHGLNHYEVWHLDDWHGQPVNLVASRLAGMDLTQCAPLRGPVVLARLPDGQTQEAERAHQFRFFGLQSGELNIQAREDLVEYYLHRTDVEPQPLDLPDVQTPEEALEVEELSGAPSAFMDAMLKALFQVQSGEADIVVVDWPDAG